MSRMHNPEHDGAADDDAGGAKQATCPVCKQEMNPCEIRNHIADHGATNE